MVYTFKDPVKARFAARRRQARAAGETFFVGNPCNDHPELKGERRTKSGGCPKCIRERMALPENRKATRDRMVRLRDAERKRRLAEGNPVRKYIRRLEKRPQL